MTKRFALAAVSAAALAAAAGPAYAQARGQISIVGSSTVFPFTTTVAEEFARGGSFQAPVVESTGTGGGMQIFCGGVGADTPDITGASRAMKESEWQLCQENGVDDVSEIQIGFDGIVVAESREGTPMQVTKAQIWQALAKEVPVDGQIVANPYTRWSEIDPSLPDEEITVFGPPPTSGTRDAFVELVMDQGCNQLPEVEALADSDADRHTAVCQTFREDGHFVEAGENDNLIVQRLVSDPTAFGIFGFSFLDQNTEQLQGVPVDGVEPTFENIADESYPVSRPLFIYVKNAHRGSIPGLTEFLTEYTSERAMGEEGYLADRGLIPLPADLVDAQRDAAANGTAMGRFGS